jgi:hypothetical protein
VEIKMDGKVRDKPRGAVQRTLPVGTVVIVTGFCDGFYEVLVGDGAYYLNEVYFPGKWQLERIKERGGSWDRHQQLDMKYGNSRDGRRIIRREIWIGMTEDMLRDSRGLPTTINRTSRSDVVTEHWVYVRTDVYLEDGIVRAKTTRGGWCLKCLQSKTKGKYCDRCGTTLQN